MHVTPRSTTSPASLNVARSTGACAAVLAVIAAVFGVFWQTTASMVDIWARSETFTHGFLVLPIVAWLVWRARSELAASPAGPSAIGALAMATAGLLWLAGELASALAAAQWGAVLMVPACILALFGRVWLRILAFPMAFLLFAVPFGEAFVPTLIEWTADFTVAALSATGVPVFREGNHFVIPSGRWSVVEACSGIRYLIASVFVGVLYAWLMYRSAVRRALFIAASMLVPIVANWMRAYLIVMIGHLSGNKLAVGVDHLIYGWVFFGAVIAVMFWLGARWREDGHPQSHRDEVATDGSLASPGGRMLPSLPVIGGLVFLLVAWPLVRDFMLVASTDPRPLQPLAIATGGGWTPVQGAIANWEPVLSRPALRQTMTFARDGQRVSVFVALYRNQEQGSELVNAMNRLVDDRGEQRWTRIGGGGLTVRFGDAPAGVRTATLRQGSERVRVWHWYWLDGHVETSDVRGKLSLALDRLLLRSDASAWVAVFVAAETDADGDRMLSDFLAAMGPALSAALAEADAR